MIEIKEFISATSDAVQSGGLVTSNALSIFVLILQAKMQSTISDLKLYMHKNFQPARKKRYGNEEDDEESSGEESAG